MGHLIQKEKSHSRALEIHGAIQGNQQAFNVLEDQSVWLISQLTITHKTITVKVEDHTVDDHQVDDQSVYDHSIEDHSVEDH